MCFAPRIGGAQVVTQTKSGEPETLAEVFAELELSAYDLSVDTLDMQADSTTFHRFDRFNLKYNPIGQSKLREVFLKSDNKIKGEQSRACLRPVWLADATRACESRIPQSSAARMFTGRYLAELTKEVFGDLEAAKYQFAEYRISIYGRKPTEWSTLATWVIDNNIISPNVRWMIQIPRLFHIYKQSKMLSTFQELLENIFEPLFRVTMDPDSDPVLHKFLGCLVGFDCVDDESKQEAARDAEVPHPSEWDLPFNPPYFYWTYYLSANINVLNQLRASRGLSTFSFRPHGGEAGDVDHLSACFLVAESVNHGITMRRSPSLQYLFYLDQVGLAMSPLSNNRLFLDYGKNPFYKYFLRGLNVSLSTDDPLLLHFTREALVEEYCVAGQVFKLNSVDLCEVARASVLQSGFEHPYKAHFIGDSYSLPGPRGNDIFLTNVPAVRLQFRLESLRSERTVITGGARRAITLRMAAKARTAKPPLPRAVAPPASPALRPPAAQDQPAGPASSAVQQRPENALTRPADVAPSMAASPHSHTLRTLRQESTPRQAGLAAAAVTASSAPVAGKRAARSDLGRALSPMSRGERPSVRRANRLVDGQSYTVYTVTGSAIGPAPSPVIPTPSSSDRAGAGRTPGDFASASVGRSIGRAGHSSPAGSRGRRGAPGRDEDDDDSSAVRGGRI